MATEKYELVRLPLRSKLVAGRFDMERKPGVVPGPKETEPNFDEWERPMLLHVQRGVPEADQREAQQVGPATTTLHATHLPTTETVTLADAGDQHSYSGIIDSQRPCHAVVFPLQPAPDGTKRLGLAMLHETLKFDKRPWKAASAADEPDAAPVVLSRSRPTLLAGMRAGLLAKQGRTQESTSLRASTAQELKDARVAAETGLDSKRWSHLTSEERQRLVVRQAAREREARAADSEVQAAPDLQPEEEFESYRDFARSLEDRVADDMFKARWSGRGGSSRGGGGGGDGDLELEEDDVLDDGGMDTLFDFQDDEAEQEHGDKDLQAEMLAELQEDAEGEKGQDSEEEEEEEEEGAGGDMENMTEAQRLQAQQERSTRRFLRRLRQLDGEDLDEPADTAAPQAKTPAPAAEGTLSSVMHFAGAAAPDSAGGAQAGPSAPALGGQKRARSDAAVEPAAASGPPRPKRRAPGVAAPQPSRGDRSSLAAVKGRVVEFMVRKGFSVAMSDMKRFMKKDMKQVPEAEKAEYRHILARAIRAVTTQMGDGDKVVFNLLKEHCPR